MVTKERLEELIEQCETIWAVNFYNKDIEKLKLNSNLDTVNSREFMKYDIKQYYYLHYSFDDLFETEEDARWELEMTATRTETLKLPNYEDVFKQDRCLDCYTKEFAITKTDIVIGICLFSVDFTNKVVGVDVGADKMFIGELTKENYIEACKLCKKLFLGEEV